MSTSAPIACSMCYGSGYNMAGQPCSCGSLRTITLSKRSEIVQLRAENAELTAQLAAAEKDACALWMMLDDIDTGGDIAKADDVLYRAIAERSHNRRFEPRFEWVIKAIDAAIAAQKVEK